MEGLSGAPDVTVRILAAPAAVPRTFGAGLVLGVVALLLVGGPGALFPFAAASVVSALLRRKWRGAASRLALLTLIVLAVLVGLVLQAWSFEVFDTASPLARPVPRGT